MKMQKAWKKGYQETVFFEVRRCFGLLQTRGHNLSQDAAGEVVRVMQNCVRMANTIGLQERVF